MKNIAKGVVSDWDSKNIDDIASDPKLLKDLHAVSYTHLTLPTKA